MSVSGLLSFRHYRCHGRETSAAHHCPCSNLYKAEKAGDFRGRVVPSRASASVASARTGLMRHSKQQLYSMTSSARPTRCFTTNIPAERRRWFSANRSAVRAPRRLQRETP